MATPTRADQRYKTQALRKNAVKKEPVAEEGFEPPTQGL